MLENLDAEGAAKVKMVSPARRREAVKHLVQRFHVSQRRACRVLGQPRPTQSYGRLPTDYAQRLVKRMKELAAENPRWGYRPIATLLVGEGLEGQREMNRVVQTCDKVE